MLVVIVMVMVMLMVVLMILVVTIHLVVVTMMFGAVGSTLRLIFDAISVSMCVHLKQTSTDNPHGIAGIDDD